MDDELVVDYVEGRALYCQDGTVLQCSGTTVVSINDGQKKTGLGDLVKGDFITKVSKVGSSVTHLEVVREEE